MHPEKASLATLKIGPVVLKKEQTVPDVLIQAAEVVDNYESRLQELELQEEKLRHLIRFQVDKLLTDSQTRPFLLPNTGWNMEEQLIVWAKDSVYSQAEGKTFEESREKSLAKTEEDIWGFYWEYLKRRLVLPIHADIQEINGQRRVMAYRYDNRPYEEVVGPAERGGAVKEAIEEIVAVLPRLSPGSMIVMASPSGWSGLGAPHPDSQTYVFKINQKNQLEALTIRSGMDLEENEDFMASLRGEEDISPISLNERERIKRIVESFVVLEGSEKEYDFIDVAEAIQAARNSPYLLTDKEVDLEGRVRKIKVRTFEELHRQLENKDDLSLLEQRIQIVIDHFKDWARGNIHDLSADSFSQLATEIGRTIFSIFRAIDEFEAEENEARRVQLVFAPLPNFSPKEAEERLEQIQAIGGCNGGGGETISNLVGMRQVKTDAEGTVEIKCCGLWVREGSRCPACGRIV